MHHKIKRIYAKTTIELADIKVLILRVPILCIHTQCTRKHVSAEVILRFELITLHFNRVSNDYSILAENLLKLGLFREEFTHEIKQNTFNT